MWIRKLEVLEERNCLTAEVPWINLRGYLNDNRIPILSYLKFLLTVGLTTVFNLYVVS